MLVTVEEVRAALDGHDDLSDDEITDAIETATELIESLCGVSFTSTETTEALSGNATTVLTPSKARITEVSAASIDGTALTTGDIVLTSVGLYYASGWTRGVGNVAITYTHGYEETPLPVKRAVIRLASHYLLPDPSNYFERASSLTTEDATYALETPGRGVATAIPEVNAVVSLYRYDGPVVF